MKLQLTYPLKEIYITQRFGNKNPQLYGLGILGHNGIDFRAKHGTPIYASNDGYASYQIDAGGGHGVVVITDKEYESIDGQSSYWKTIYWHMPDPLKEPRLASWLADKTGFTFVSKGQLLGYADNTGRSTGSHLHYGLKPVAKGENWGTYFNAEQSNGYFGAVDPEPYLPGKQWGFTWNFTNNLKVGSRGMDVVMLQKVLIELGYLEDKADGIYGVLTRYAVLAFQINEKVIKFPLESWFGYYCGPKTRVKLNEILPKGS